jgi:CheY-like chemotaxis protein
LMMPEIDGFEFLDTFKHNGDWRDIPVIVITGMSLSTKERDRLLGQVRKVIAKGGSINVDITAAIGEAVRRRPARAAANASA